METYCTPDPLHALQLSGFLPVLVPIPLHDLQFATVSTVTVFLAPLTESIKDIVKGS